MFKNYKKLLSSILLFFLIPLPSYGWGIRLRGRIYKRLLGECGNNLALSSLVNIYNPSTLKCGNNVYIGYCCYIGDGDITIDDEVVIGPYVSITGGNHLFKDGSVRFGGYQYKPISIGKGSWIGAHSSILAGVKIGKGCIVAAGTVVNKDVPDGMVVGGVPAKVIKENDPDSGLNGIEQVGMQGKR